MTPKRWPMADATLPSMEGVSNAQVSKFKTASTWFYDLRTVALLTQLSEMAMLRGGVYSLGQVVPKIAKGCWVAPNAAVVGNVVMKEGSSVRDSRARFSPRPPALIHAVLL